MKSKLLALAVSATIGFLLMECGLRLIYEPAPEWLEPQVRHERSPLLQWVLPADYRGYTIDALVETNSLGLRDDTIPLEKPAGETRILCLGDSFTFAMGVEFDDLYVQWLEREFNEHHAPRRFQVINAGVAGYNTRQELIYLMAQGLDFAPDLVTVGFYWNDLVGNEPALPDLEQVSMRLPAGEAEDYGSGAGHVLPHWIRDGLRRSLVLYLGVTRAKALLATFDTERPEGIHLVQRAILDGDSAVLAPYWRATEQRLLEIARLAKERDIPVVLLAFPMENQVRGEFPDAEYAEKLREIWEPTGQPFIDIEPSYREALAEGTNPFLPYDLHPGPAGMQIAGRAIYQTIRDSQLLDLGQGS